MSPCRKYIGLQVLRSISRATTRTATLPASTINRRFCLHSLLPRYNCRNKTDIFIGANCDSQRCFHKYQNIMDAPPGVFKGSLDRFNGVTVASNDEFEENENFPEKLEKSLQYWKSQKRRAIWFYVKTEHSSWVPHLTNVGFEFHHAKQGFVVLYRWLPVDEYENIPVYSHTMLGVGGLVVNKNNEVLVVCERFSLIPNSWKLPGGYAEPKENIVDAAIREVREETGIECDFNTVISIRHSHSGIFGCSDIYCVVALTPKTSDLHRCKREIAKLQWMPVEEYLEHPNVHETNRHFMRCFMDYQKRGVRFTCEIGKHQILKKEYCLYYMKPIEEGSGVSEQTEEAEKHDKLTKCISIAFELELIDTEEVMFWKSNLNPDNIGGL